MRIAQNTTVTLTDAPTSRFLLVVDRMDGDVRLLKNGGTLLSLSLSGEDAVLKVTYSDGRGATLFGRGAKDQEVIVTAGYARLGLYVAGVLWDEDFFFAPLDYQDATVEAGSFMHFEAGYEYHAASESAIVENLTDRLDGYRLSGEEYTLLRPLPHTVFDRLHLLYLDNRRGGKAKDGHGAHKLCAMFSDDGKTFHGAPIVLSIDSTKEGAVLDAALLLHDGRYYLYYIVECEGQRLFSCAVSEDGFSFQKTWLSVEIPGIENASVTSVSVLAGETPSLYFVANGNAYVAKSIDLLHFATPTALPAFAHMDKIISVILSGEEVLFAQKDGVLYRFMENALAPLSHLPNNAYPFVYENKLSYIGEENGAFSCR